jgi:hypothetical protein
MTDPGAPGLMLGGVPGIHLLQAALRVAGILDRSGTERTALRESYPRTPTGGLFDSQDLMRGEELLVQLGLVVAQGDRVIPDPELQALAAATPDIAEKLLLAISLEKDPPLWLSAAVRDDEVLDEFINDADGALLASVLPDSAEREQFLLRLGRRVDADELARLGDLGEAYVVEACRNQVAEIGGERDDVVWVSRFSDQAGYDISAPGAASKRNLLEVKSTRSQGSTFPVWISRNEAGTGSQFPDEWSLVACRIQADDSVSIMGWLPIDVIRPMFPRDRHEGGRWMSAKVRISRQVLRDGLPPLA